MALSQKEQEDKLRKEIQNIFEKNRAIGKGRIEDITNYALKINLKPQQLEKHFTSGEFLKKRVHENPTRNIILKKLIKSHFNKEEKTEEQTYGLVKSLKNVFGSKTTRDNLKKGGKYIGKGLKTAVKTGVVAGGLAWGTAKSTKNAIGKAKDRASGMLQQPTGRFMFWIAVALWIFDMAVGFSGIKYEFFLNIFRDYASFQNSFRIVWNVVTLVIIGTIIWAKLFGISENRELIGGFVLFEICNIILTLGGFNLSLLAHLAFAIVFCFGILVPYYETKGNKILAYWWTIGFIIIDFFLFPLLGYYYTSVSDMKGAFPVWVLITLCYTLKLKRGKLFSVISFGVIMFYLFAYAQPLFGGIDTGLVGIQKGDVGAKAVGDVGAKAWTNLKLSITSTQKGIKESYNKSIAYATGDYYTGRVDRNVREPLGVYITNIETLSPEVYEDEPIELWATLRAKSDIDEPIELITVKCTANLGDKEHQKEGTPKVTEFRNFIDEEEDIDCKFEAGDLEAGINTITFSARFDFTTLAYLKTYFIDNERLKALKRENIDPFNQYGITDINPIAIYTYGPVGIGMETKTPPIGISDDYYTTPKFGITIENKWLGKIEEIKDLIVYIPEGIKLEDNCDNTFEKFETGPNYLDDYNNYRLVNEVKEQWKDIQDFKSRNCRLEILDTSAVLGETPLSVKYIKSRIDYIYDSHESISVNVQTPKGFNVYFDNKKPTANEDLICIASHSDLYVVSAPFYIYKSDEEEPFIKYNPPCGEKQHKCELIIPESKFDRGDKIKCKVLQAKLSNDLEETDSAIVKIQNSAPTLTEIKFEPKSPTLESDLKCFTTVFDEEGDELSGWAEVKVNNEKISSYEYLDQKFEDGKFVVSINLKKLYDEKKLKESDKIYCKIAVVDYPGGEFERGYAESNEISVTIRKKTETTISEESNLNADCSKPENEKKSCGGSKYMNCYKFQCMVACDMLAVQAHESFGDLKINNKVVGSDWGCLCSMDVWTEQACKDSSLCLTGYCPGNNYCCSPQATI